MSQREPTSEVDCREHRHRLLIDPRDGDPALARHRSVCPQCAQTYREAQSFEAALRQAIEVAAPRQLVRHIQSMPTRLATRRVAVAAAWLLLAGAAGWLGYGVLEHRGPAPQLAEVVVEHIRNEEVHVHARERVRVDRLVALFEQLGGELMADPGPVRFAGLCVIRGNEGAHLVLKGRRGPVTLLFMPGERLTAAQEIRSEGLHGWILPTEYGSLAVVGEPGEALEALLEQVRRSLQWRT
jgi:hypothetical protein